MRIVCPNCQATYDVPDALLSRGPGRVRCARCATEWAPQERPAAPAPATPFADAMAQVAAPPAPEPHVAAPPPPAPPPAEPPPPARNTLAMAAARDAQLERPLPRTRTPRDSATLLFAWSLSVGIVLAALGAAYVNRAEIVAAWPPAARAYQVLGIR